MEFNFDGMNLPFPAARINNKAEITAINPVFSSRFALKAENSVNYKLSDIMESYNPQIAEQDAVIRAKSYKVFTVEDTGENDEIFYNVYIIEKEEEDETGINNIVVGLIFVDNYNEVLETMESVRHPLITAIIDRKINNMAYELKGIISKTEKDKYIMIITADKLKHLEENKFPILDVIREINMGNSIPVTLSVGFGIHGSSLMKNMEYARAAVDLALSRGGDQVLIKDEEEYKFYGGRQKEYGANSRVRARVKAYALTELIQESKKVIIMGHKNSDMDCLGAAVGVHRIVKSFEKECKIVLEGVNTAIKRLFDRLMKEDDYCDSFIDSE
ncbi:MAG: hypothetical protein IJ736_03075, partial [Firmicutes bacterium]|nr:hypothetical protein [Bacillota bacterium]